MPLLLTNACPSQANGYLALHLSDIGLVDAGMVQLTQALKGAMQLVVLELNGNAFGMLGYECLWKHLMAPVLVEPYTAYLPALRSLEMMAGHSLSHFVARLGRQSPPSVADHSEDLSFSDIEESHLLEKEHPMYMRLMKSQDRLLESYAGVRLEDYKGFEEGWVTPGPWRLARGRTAEWHHIQMVEANRIEGENYLDIHI